MSDTKPAFVFVHGGWHNSACWRLAIPLLEKSGYIARAFDLPGAGIHAKMPLAYYKRGLDEAAFATAASPSADVTQADRTRATVTVVEETVSQTGGPVVLVGHSLGGLTITQVAEAVPDRLSALVYVTAFLLPPGKSVFTLPEHTLAESLTPPLWLGDTRAIGAMRIDPRPDNAAYRERLRAAFYGDMSEFEFAQAIADLHCDEPVAVMLEPSAITSARFGQVPRHYVRCLKDRSIPLSAQDLMIAAVDDAMGSPTCTHELSSSHSPFYSQPRALADILVHIAG